MNIDDSIVGNWAKVNPQKAKDVIAEMNLIRSGTYNEFAATPCKTFREVGQVPSDLYHALNRQYSDIQNGYYCWSDPKFVHMFFNIYDKFKSAGRI